MKKLVILSGILCLLISSPAKAQISIQAFFGEPEPIYVESPVYVSRYPVYPTYIVEPTRYHERYVTYYNGRDHHRRKFKNGHDNRRDFYHRDNRR